MSPFAPIVRNSCDHRAGLADGVAMSRPFDPSSCSRALALLLAAGVGASLCACASTPPSSAGAPATDTRADAPPVDDLAAQIAADAAAFEEWFNNGAEQARARRDADRLAQGEPRLPAPAPEPLLDEPVATLPANAGVSLDEPAPVEMEVAQAQPAPPAPVEPEPTPQQRIERLTAELAARLRERAESGERPLQALAALAALELVQPGVFDQPAGASLLTTRERDALALWRDMLRYAGRSLSENDSAGALLRSVRVASDQAREFATLELAKVALCARVDGFGQYAELQSSKILAGKAHRVGLYVEVDGFGARAASDHDGAPAYRVELTRELSLYHDADGLLAWRRPAVDITDVSRNRRRDFFFSEVIDLPQTLTVGSYRLKVSVTDRVTGAVAEAILPLDVVADARLTRGE